MRKVLSLGLALVFMASVARAAVLPTVVVPDDARGRSVTTTFHKGAGDRAWLLYSTADAETLNQAGLAIPNPGGTVGWLTVQVPENATLTALCLQFKEIDTGITPPATYTWGDKLWLYVGGEYRHQIFQVGAWDSLKFWGLGSESDSVRLYYWMEFNAR